MYYIKATEYYELYAGGMKIAMYTILICKTLIYTINLDFNKYPKYMYLRIYSIKLKLDL